MTILKPSAQLELAMCGISLSDKRAVQRLLDMGDFKIKIKDRMVRVSSLAKSFNVAKLLWLPYWIPHLGFH